MRKRSPIPTRRSRASSPHWTRDSCLRRRRGSVMLRVTQGEEHGMPDYDHLRFDELASISEFLHGLADEQWDHDSLGAVGQVRHGVSHMTLGYTTPFLEMVAKVGKHGFNVPRASAKESVEFGSSHTPAEILVRFDTIPNDHVRKGISKLIPTKEALLDHVVHQQDMRRPLGMPRQVPEDRLVAA